jgi:glycosyltransferase involved in cell wall biosynthesis
MKSVCILLQNHYEIDIRVRRKAEALVVAGYTVDVLALHSSYSRGKAYEVCGVNVHTFSLGKKRGSRIRYLFEYGAFLVWACFKLNRLMGRRSYAVIDVNTLPDFLIFAACFARWRGAKLVLDMHEITPEFLMSKYGFGPGHLQVRFAAWIERLSVRYADHVITINEPIQRLIEDRCRAPVPSTIIMNAADEAIFAAAANAPVMPDTAGPRPKFLMMYHGTLTRIYGLDIAMEAFGMAQQQMPGAELWILGNGPEKSSLEALARRLGLASRVRFVGSVLPDEIPQWLRRCDVGVLATRRDVFLEFSFSNKLSEYIIMRKAVISSRLRTIRHYFSESALAFFEPNAPADLAKQMIALYQDAALRDRLAAQALREFEPIRWEVMKERYLKLMDALTGTSRETAGLARSAEAAPIGR